MDTEAADVYLRLMKLDAQENDWSAVFQNAQRYLAVNPLVAPPYRYLAQASEHLDRAENAIEANRALLELDPSNPAEVHYDLARLLYRTGKPDARRQVLQALEIAPRYRDALRLLLQVDAENPPPTPQPAASKPETTGTP